MKQRSLEEWQRADAAHYLHPFTDSKALAAKGTRVITRGEGIYIYDANGHKMLDGMSGLWCVNVGYGRKELIEAATRADGASCRSTTASSNARIRRRFGWPSCSSEVTPPHMNHVFFTSSGSEANDTVHPHGAPLLGERRATESHRHHQPRKRVSRQHDGRRSLGGMAYIHKQGGLPIPGIEHIPQPYYFDYRGNLSAEEFGIERARDLERRIESVGADRRRRVHRRTDSGRGRRDHAARQLLAGDPPHLREVRNPARGRRSDHRFRPHRPLVRIASTTICKPDLLVMAKGMSSGYLPIGGVMVGDRVANVHSRRRRLQPRLHVLRPSDVRRGRGAQHRTAARRAHRRTRARRCGALSREALGASSPSTRSSAKRARSDCSARSSWSPTNARRRVSSRRGASANCAATSR